MGASFLSEIMARISILWILEQNIWGYLEWHICVCQTVSPCGSETSKMSDLVEMSDMLEMS